MTQQTRERFRIVTVHGEHGSLFCVVDTRAPESEQPAVRIVCTTRRRAENVARFHNAHTGVIYYAAMTKRNQGKVVIEPDEGGYLVVTPDGEVSWKPTKAAAERHARAWFKAHLDGADVGIGAIEWR